MRKLNLLIFVLLFLLSGCSSDKGVIAKTEDTEKVYIEFKYGLSADSLDLIHSLDIDSVVGLSSFSVNDRVFYGVQKNYSFSTFSELTSFLSDSFFFVDLFSLSFTNLSPSFYSLNLDISPFINPLNLNCSEYTEQDLLFISNNSYCTFSIYFPYFIYEIELPKGVESKNNKLILDLVELAEKGDYTIKFVLDKEYTFPYGDVPVNHWAYPAIYTLSRNQLISNENSYNPDISLTRGEFYQLLAGAMGITEKNKELIDDILSSFGDIVDFKSTVPILREEVVAVLSLTSEYVGIENLNYRFIIESSIPDLDDVTLIYRDYILMAFEKGITTGTDRFNNFNPKGVVTKAQICQMFYNIGWISPLNDIEVKGGVTS